MECKEIFDTVTITNTDLGPAILVDEFNKFAYKKNLQISKLQKSLDRKKRIIRDLLEDMDE